MLNKPIWALSATELVKKTKDNELSATEVTSAYLEHIKKVNPELNAIVDDMSDEAIKRAEILDRATIAGEPKGRLFGVPGGCRVKTRCRCRVGTGGRTE